MAAALRASSGASEPLAWRDRTAKQRIEPPHRLLTSLGAGSKYLQVRPPVAYRPRSCFLIMNKKVLEWLGKEPLAVELRIPNNPRFAIKPAFVEFVSIISR